MEGVAPSPPPVVANASFGHMLPSHAAIHDCMKEGRKEGKKEGRYEGSKGYTKEGRKDYMKEGRTTMKERRKDYRKEGRKEEL